MHTIEIGSSQSLCARESEVSQTVRAVRLSEEGGGCCCLAESLAESFHRSQAPPGRVRERLVSSLGPCARAPWLSGPGSRGAHCQPPEQHHAGHGHGHAWITRRRLRRGTGTDIDTPQAVDVSVRLGGDPSEWLQSVPEGLLAESRLIDLC